MNDKYLLHQKFLKESHLAWVVHLSDKILSCNILGQSLQQINIWISKAILSFNYGAMIISWREYLVGIFSFSHYSHAALC